MFLVKAQLLAQALELGFKSFLIFKGIALDDLKNKYGHDFYKCYCEARNKGFTFKFNNILTENYLQTLNEAYRNKGIVYGVHEDGKIINLPFTFRYIGEIKNILDAINNVLKLNIVKLSEE